MADVNMFVSMLSGNDWANGADNQRPSKHTNVSSFDAMDTLLDHFANKTAFPNIKAITLAGHSAGGQVKYPPPLQEVMFLTNSITSLCSDTPW
jgi:hypothetical protein